MSDLIELPFETDGGFGSRATIGLVVLETDHTLEPEVRSIHVPGVVWYHSRIHMEPEVSAETLTDMRERLPEAAKLCLLYTSPSPRDGLLSRMPSSA